MRLPITLAILFLAAPAAAQPPASAPAAVPDPCAVTIVRAPDDVRSVIETWVHNEAACKIALDVRVIPTAGGLYLLARESTGRVHERLVPDAQAAGVLVASWVADDSLEPVPVPPAGPLAVAAVAPMTSPGPVVDRAVVACEGIGCERRHAPADGVHWALGVTVLRQDVSGTRLRGELGIMRRGGLELGIIVAGAYSNYGVIDDEAGLFLSADRVDRIDLRALAGLSWTLHEGPWQLRLQAAAGGVWAHTFHSEAELGPPGTWTGYPLEASIMAGYRVGDEWTVGIAPVGTVYLTRTDRDRSAALPGSDLGVVLELRHGS